jgi:integrase
MMPQIGDVDDLKEASFMALSSPPSTIEAKRIVDDATSDFAFPRYTSAKRCNANSASGSINKWLKPRLSEGCVIHSFRHSFRDRLRDVDCPTEVIDQLGGWSSSTVGSKYGQGYSLAKLQEWILKIEYNSSPVSDTKTL